MNVHCRFTTRDCVTQIVLQLLIHTARGEGREGGV